MCIAIQWTTYIDVKENNTMEKKHQPSFDIDDVLLCTLCV